MHKLAIESGSRLTYGGEVETQTYLWMRSGDRDLPMEEKQIQRLTYGGEADTQTYLWVRSREADLPINKNRRHRLTYG